MNVIPIFCAVDDGYAPYLAVALRSLRANTSQPLLLAFLPPSYAWPIAAVNLVLSALPVFVLRYNLSTLQYLYKKARA